MSATIILAIAVLIVGCIGCAAYIWYNAYQYRMHPTDGTNLFGVHVPMNDFFSIINTLAMYVYCDKQVDLKNFFDASLLQNAELKDFKFVETMINSYPLIKCDYYQNGIFVLDEVGTAEKLAKFQAETGTDNYILPLFDISIIQRNADIFNISTKYQQAKVIDNILDNKVKKRYFENPEKLKRFITEKMEDEILVEKKETTKAITKLVTRFIPSVETKESVSAE